VTDRRLPSPFIRILVEEFGDEALARELFAEFLGRMRFARAFALRLVDVAGGKRRWKRTSWRLRCAAALMLESQIWATPASENGELELILRSIAGSAPGGLRDPSGRSILAESHGTSVPETFVAELRGRMARLERIHRRISDPARKPEALRDFLDISRQPCRLTLARYLFDPRATARQVLARVRTSHGLALPSGSPMVEAEAQSLISEWPEHEQRFLRELLDSAEIFWADESTGGRLNDLVEYPLGTVALVVKPPGSSLEIEIKRAGRPGNHPLSVVFERNGQAVPPSHRLDGGSMKGPAKAEAAAAARFGRLYQLVHHRRAPISHTLTLRSIYEVPTAGCPAPLLDYFTDPEIFGNGFEEMRRDMERSIRSFCNEWTVERLGTPGELGQTVDFLAQVSPTQAVLGGTSSFRLEQLARYLADEGPDLYFRAGLGVTPTKDDARRLAETLSDEILGKFDPVEIVYRRQSEYLDAIFSSPGNRRRADAVFLELSAEAGRFWGTLVALKGYSNGESLVGRNVGLKSVWERGDWRVRIIFLDHDQLSVPSDGFSPPDVLRGWRRDAAHILGEPGQGRKCVSDWLAIIYRVDSAVAKRGRKELLRAAVDAARLTRARLANDPAVRAYFQPDCLMDASDWEAAAAAFVRARRCGRSVKAAIAAGRKLLANRGRPPDFVTRSMDAVEQFAELLAEHGALLVAET
jgi:hypothetical protein